MESYRYQSSIFGSLGFSIDEIVNSPRVKALVAAHWKARLDYEKDQAIKNEEEKNKYFIYLERQLGQSLRFYIERGNWIPFLGWLRHHSKDILFWMIQVFFWTFIIGRIK